MNPLYDPEGAALEPPDDDLEPADVIGQARVHAAVEAAQDAFWAEVASRFPEAVTGDLDPAAILDLDDAARRAVLAWINTNATGVLG